MTTVKELKEILENMPNDAEIAFQEITGDSRKLMSPKMVSATIVPAVRLVGDRTQQQIIVGIA